jgi:hypothetical protein
MKIAYPTVRQAIKPAVYVFSDGQGAREALDIPIQAGSVEEVSVGTRHMKSPPIGLVIDPVPLFARV